MGCFHVCLPVAMFSSHLELVVVKMGPRLQELRLLIPKIEAARLFLGRGGVYMREGVCRIMAAMAQAGLALPAKTVLRCATLSLLVFFFFFCFPLFFGVV